MENSSTSQMRIPEGCIETIQQAIEKFPDHENLQEQGHFFYVQYYVVQAMWRDRETPVKARETASRG